MGFPQWPNEDHPSWPYRPTLRLSVGYGTLPRHVKDYHIKGQLGDPSIADQVLCPKSDSCPRLDYLIHSSEYWRYIDCGWRNIDAGEFEIIDGRPPVFLVTNIFHGDWQGGFRFGGVELQLISEQ